MNGCTAFTSQAAWSTTLIVRLPTPSTGCLT